LKEPEQIDFRRQGTAMLEALLELVGEAILEMLAHLLSGLAAKVLEVAQEMWAMFLGR